MSSAVPLPTTVNAISFLFLLNDGSCAPAGAAIAARPWPCTSTVQICPPLPSHEAPKPDVKTIRPDGGAVAESAVIGVARTSAATATIPRRSPRRPAAVHDPCVIAD